MKAYISTLVVLMLMSASTASAQTEYTSGTINIGVVVSDLEASLDFYTNVMGMTRTGGFDINADFSKTSGLTGGVPTSVAVLKLLDAEQATEWKLMSFNKPAGHERPTYIQDDTGMQYITVFVRALKPFLERIEAHNVKLLGETPVPLGTDRHFALIQDPDGTFIELIGPMGE